MTTLHWCRNFIYHVILLYLHSIRYRFFALVYSSSARHYKFDRNIQFTISDHVERGSAGESEGGAVKGESGGTKKKEI
jgi:hypothetical protein